MKLYEQIRRARERTRACRSTSCRGGSGCIVGMCARRWRRRCRRRGSAATRAAPVLDPWKPTIEEWLEADRSAPRKQRHTARRVWQRLVEEHGAEVGESTVRRYVAEVRRRHDGAAGRGDGPPAPRRWARRPRSTSGRSASTWPGCSIEVPLFIMRLSASGRAFPRAYLNEAQEVFLDGHVRAFEHFGGVPRPDPLRQLEGGGRAGVEGPGPDRVGPVHRPAFPLRVRQLLLPARHQGQPREGRRRGRGRPVPAPPSGPGPARRVDGRAQRAARSPPP